MKVFKKVLLAMFALLLIAGITLMTIKIVPILNDGYALYENVLAENNIEDTVKKVKSKDGYIKLEDISENYRECVIQSEDKRFYSHGGIDLLSTARAMAVNLKEGAFVQGGSTITQQLAKNLFFSFEKSYVRKVAELMVAFKLEKELTKDEIFELYLNVAYFGEECYGIGNASQHYYNVNASNINDAQIAVLVNTLKSPNKNNPNALKAA